MRDYSIAGELIAEFDPASGELKKEYIYGADGLAATIAAGEGTRYVTADHLGSPRIITSTTGAVISRHDYQPFGEELFVVMGSRTSAQGYGVEDGLRKQFTSKERDAETGLDYFLARYYSSMQGRFTSPDEFTGGPDELFDFVDDASNNPTFYADLENPQSLNKYQYTYNNPINLIDPDGHCPDCIWDAVNFVMGGASLVDNVKQGNYGSATIDGVGMIIDGVATLAPGIPGGAGTIIKVLRGADKVADGAKTVGKADKAADATKAAEREVDSVQKTSRAARREAMRQEGIPTSQQPVRQSGNSKVGRSYDYKTPKPGGGTKTKTVTNDPRPRSKANKHGPHWEAGTSKQGRRRDKYGRTRYKNEDQGKKKTRVGY